MKNQTIDQSQATRWELSLPLRVVCASLVGALLPLAGCDLPEGPEASFDSGDASLADPESDPESDPEQEPEPEAEPEPEPESEFCELATGEDLILEDVEYRLPNAGDHVLAGDGFDSLTAAVLPSCVESAHESTSGNEANWDVRLLETRADVAEHFSVGVSLSAGFLGYGFGSSFDHSKASAISETSVNLAITVDVVNGGLRATEASLTEDMEELRTADPAQFYRLCGDRYVHAVRQGGKLEVLLSIETYSREDQTALSAALSASFGGFVSLDAEYEEEFAQAIGSREVSIVVNRIGGEGGLPPMTNFEELMEYAAAFADEVDNNTDSTVASFVTRPYERIAPPACVPAPTRAASALLGDSWGLLHDLYETRNRINLILDRPVQYPCFAPAADNLEHQLELANLNIAEVETLSRRCSQEMVDDPSLVAATSCPALDAFVADYVGPELPLRADQTPAFVPDANIEHQAFQLPAASTCELTDVLGYWTPAPNAPIETCPTGEFRDDLFVIDFEDRVDDNASTCEYRFRCVEDANVHNYECL